MEQSFEAQLLEGASTTVFSPWMPREGDYMIGTAELIALEASAQLEVRLFTKDLDDPGDGAQVDSSIKITISVAGRRDSAEWGFDGTTSGLKELVRYRFESRAATAAGSVLFRMLSPVWFDAVLAP